LETDSQFDIKSKTKLPSYQLVSEFSVFPKKYKKIIDDSFYYKWVKIKF